MKRIGCDLWNEWNAVLEKRNNKELIERIRGDPVIYVCSIKDFEIAWKKNGWKEISSSLWINIVSAQKKV